MSVPPTTLPAAHSHISPFVRLALDSFREKTAINSINNRLCADLATTEESSVKSFDGVLTSLYTIKLEVDITLCVWIKGNVDNMTVFLLAFSLNIIFKLFDPGIAFFSVYLLAEYFEQEKLLTLRD